MGICKEIYDKRIDDLDFVMDLDKHGRYRFSERELNRIKWKESAVDGIPLGIMLRAGMFSEISE